MFAFTAAGDFVRKAAGKLSKDGNVTEEGNLPTTLPSKRSSPRTVVLPRMATLPLLATSLPMVVVWLSTGSPPSLPWDASLPWNATGIGTKACEFAYDGKFANGPIAKDGNYI